jgi:hypothetical protein
MNPHLKSRLEAILTQLKAAHAGGGGVSNATRGSEREAFVDLLLRGCLPLPYRFGSGDVTDAHGNRSGQLDLVIEHPFFPSFPLLGTSQQRLYLIESVAMAIEVKSSHTQWKEAVETMKKFRAVDPEADWPKEEKRARSIMSGGAIGQRGHTCFPGRVGFSIVLYEGWQNAATLQNHCDQDDVDVALQLTPPIFYARRYRVYVREERTEPKVVEGSEALAAFIFVVSEELRTLSDWDSHVFRRYVEQQPPPK